MSTFVNKKRPVADATNPQMMQARGSGALIDFIPALPKAMSMG
jgi:hypothetical protein